MLSTGLQWRWAISTTNSCKNQLWTDLEWDINLVYELCFKYNWLQRTVFYRRRYRLLIRSCTYVDYRETPARLTHPPWSDIHSIVMNVFQHSLYSLCNVSQVVWANATTHTKFVSIIRLREYAKSTSYTLDLSVCDWTHQLNRPIDI